MKKGEELAEEIRRKNAEFAAAKRAKDDAEWAEWSMYDPEVHSVADAEQLLGEKGVRPGEGPGAWMLVLEPGEASVAKTPAAERMEAALVPEPGDKITFRMQEFLGLHLKREFYTHSLWARTPQIGFHMKNMHFFLTLATVEELERGRAVGRAVTRGRKGVHEVGAQDVLGAVRAAVERLRAGARALVWATSEHANGDFGVRRRVGGADVAVVPGGAAVLVEVAVGAVEWRVPDQQEIEARVPMPRAACLAIAYRAQAAGNAEYRRGAWRAALRAYNKGLFALTLPVARDAAETRALQGVLHCNSARAHLQLRDAAHAEVCARRALDGDVDSVPARFLLARALLAAGRGREACDELDRAALLAPGNAQLRALRTEAAQRAREEAASSFWAGKLQTSSSEKKQQ